MFSPHRSIRRKQSRRLILRLETIEDRVTPALVVGVNVDGTSTDEVPPVGNSGSVGPNDFVQFTIGQFTVFSKAGAQEQQEPDSTFWSNAGISSTILADSLAEPRVIYDALTDRWFAAEITLKATSNQILLARSDSGDPTGSWTAVNYTATSQFGNFPTLGVDANGVYIGTGNFSSSSAGASPTGSTMTAIPKADLLLATPTIANKKTVTQVASPSVPMGWSPQAVTNFDPNDTVASVIATHYDTFDLVSYWEINWATSPPTFGATTNRTIPHNALPGEARQPNGTQDISGGDDDRYTGAIYQVGDLIYAVHPISVNSSGVGTTAGANTTDAVQLLVIRDSTNTVVATANYFNPNYDYTYASVAANQFGDIVIGLNRSGGSSSSNGNLGAFAVHARIDPANPTTITFLDETQIAAGEADDYNLDGTGIEPWGPYSATSPDPTNPFEFWTTQEYVKIVNDGTAWGTRVAQTYVSPRLTSVTSTTADGTYGVGAQIQIDVAFNGPVSVSGAPELLLNSGGVAHYTSGSGTNTLTFTYTVASGEFSTDLDYTSTNALTLNGGSINLNVSDAVVPAELTLAAPGTSGSLGFGSNININAIVPTVTNVTSSATNTTHDFGDVIPITVQLSRPALVTGTPQLALNSGGIAFYSSGSGSTSLIFNYTVGANQFSTDLDYSSTSALTLNGGTITDQSNGGAAGLTLPTPGAAGSLSFNKDIAVDSRPPSVSGVTSPATDGTYNFGAVLSISVSFSKNVVVTTTSGTPTLALNSGGTATYSSGSGSSTLSFLYTVGAGQSSSDLDYVSASALQLNGGTIVEPASGQNANLNLPAPGTAGSLGANKAIVIDTTQPRVTNVTSPTANGSYIVGAAIDISVQFDTPIFVTGTPLLTLNSGGTASYASGSGTGTLTFHYIVAVGDSATDLDYTSNTALSLNGGTIQDSTGLDANLTLPAPGSPGSLGANKNIKVDGIVPTVLEFRVLFGAKKYDLLSSARFDVPWRITGLQAVFSEPVVTGTRLSLTGLPAFTFSGKNTNVLTWKFLPITKGSFNLSLADSGVNALKDASGNPIAAFSHSFNVLYGDFNDDHVVNATDESQIRQLVAAPYHLSPANYNIFADLSGDGLVNLVDVGTARARRGNSLP
jgi:hypothetical protein